MDLVVQIVVILKASEWFEHFLDLSAEVLDQGFVFDAQALLSQAVRFLLYARLLLIHYRLEDTTFVILWLDLLRFQIYDLPELVHRVAASEHFS